MSQSSQEESKITSIGNQDDTVNISQEEEKSTKRFLYQFWEGNQLYFGNGKFTFGINLYQPIFTFVLLNSISAKLIVNTIRDVTTKYPDFYAAIYVGSVLQFLCSVFLFITAGKDPATIPSRKFLYEAYKNQLDIPNDFYRMKYFSVVGGRLCKMKYCDSCEIYRPPRTIHCGDCGCCIERLDHHCPWLGTCIGKRNYKYFLCFIWSVALLVIEAISFTSWHIYDNTFNTEAKSYSDKQIISFIILSLAAFLGLFVFWLLGYHQYILYRNETTNENLKASYKKLGNPFQRGCCDNIGRLCRPDKRNWIPTNKNIQNEIAQDIKPGPQRKQSQQRVLKKESFTLSTSLRSGM